MDEEIVLKRCCTCKEHKPLEAFAKNKNKKDGRGVMCKTCVNAANQKRRDADPQKYRNYGRKHYDKKKEEDHERLILYYRSHRKDWDARNPGRSKATGRTNRLKNYYHLTLDEFDRICQEQEDKCGVCGTTEPGGTHGVWQVDHDHDCCNDKKSCGQCVRGLLCWHCNVGLGLLKTKEILEKALAYIQTPTIRKRWSEPEQLDYIHEEPQ